MTSDDERREVARRLREYVDLPDDWWQETCAEFYIEKCAFGNVDRHSEAELFTRLADLIEPSGHGCVPGECPLNVCHDNDRIDRDALMELADELDENAELIIRVARNAQFTGCGPTMEEAKHDACEWHQIAQRIREALGVYE